MDTHWKRYKIFISSTFKDMDVERDIIKQNVIPAINKRYRSQRIEFQAIDLRLGINTSQMSEENSANKVLQVCAQCIDSARPFFIGLIGGRYGWIPPMERWREFIGRLDENDRELMKETFGKSVTEMEIVYGALCHRSLDTSHILFYLRDEESYNGVPGDLLAQFCDSDPQQVEKLQDLRNRIVMTIRSYGEKDDCVSRYHMNWTEDGFEDDNFASLVIEQLSSQIDHELEKEQMVQQAWWEKERSLHESVFSKCLNHIYTDLDCYKVEPTQLIICGGSGSGKTYLLSYLWQRRMQETDDVCLVASVGLTPKSHTMRDIIVRWCVELETLLNIDDICDTDKFMDPSQTSMAHLCDEFYWAVSEVKEQLGRDVSLFLDSVEMFRIYSPVDITLSWIYNRVNVVVACNILYIDNLVQTNKNLDFVTLDDWKKKDISRLIEFYEKDLFFDMPQKMVKLLLLKPHTPVFIRSVFRLFTDGMNGGAFAEIRQSKGNQIDIINDYITDVYKTVFDDNEDNDEMVAATVFTILGGTSGIDVDWWRIPLGYIASCPCGLTQKDIALLAGEDWDEVEWEQLTFFLGDFLNENPTDHTWRALGDINSYSFDDDTPYEDLSEYIMELPDDDFLHENMFHYVSLKGGIYLEDYSHFSQISANLLMAEDWFTDGHFEEYCEELSDENKEILTSAITQALFGDRIDTSHDTVALNNAAQNIIGHFADKKERKQILEDIKSINEIQPALKMEEDVKRTFCKILGRDMVYEKTSEAESFNRISEKVRHLKEKGDYLEAVKEEIEFIACIDIEKYRADQSGNTTHRIDDIFLLENLTLQLINLYGAADELLNDKKAMKHIDEDIICNICSLANEGSLATYHRLCQLLPQNFLIQYLSAPLNIINSEADFKTNTLFIVETIDMLLKEYNSLC